MDNERIISYQQAADELCDSLIRLYNVKIFPRMGKIFADQLFLAGTEAGGFLSALADLDEIHVKRDTAQSALVRLKRADYILKTMQSAGYYTALEAEDLVVFFNKIIPAVKALLEEVYKKINKENEELLGHRTHMDEGVTGEDGYSVMPTGSEEEEDHDPDGFYKAI